MGKIRIFELAKEMGIGNKIIMQKLTELGYEVTNHFTGLDDDQVAKIKKTFAPQNAPQQPAQETTQQPTQETTLQPTQQPIEPPKKNIHIRRFDVPSEKPRDNRNQNQNRGPYNQNPAQGPQGQPGHSGQQQGYNRPQGQPGQPGQQQGYNRPQGQPGQPGQQQQGYNRPQGQPGQPGQQQGYNRPQGQPGQPGQQQGYNRPQGQPGQPGQQQGYRPQGQPGQNTFPNKPSQDAKPFAPGAKPINQVQKPGKPEKKNKFDQETPTEKKLTGKYNNNNNNTYNKRGKGKNFKGRQQRVNEEPIPLTIHKAVIGETVTVQELAKGIGKSAAEVIKKLFAMGVMATINQEIDSDTAVIIANEFGAQVEVRLDKTFELIEDYQDQQEDLITRPPIVTVMGHVDHGKTSLLDAIRQANVIATEAGGITQHIGAYQVEINNRKITFLDTPGHEAFTAMRARGAKVTDIAVLVVAADDGIMPQTVEAINHAKAAEVPIIIAINKIDKPGANPDKVMQELTQHGLVPEVWGGDTICVNVSAKKQIGISNLLEMILLTADILELKANPKREARGTVVEAQLDKGRGPVATMLVDKGTLKIGDIVVVGATYGRVRAMHDDKGRKVKTAGPAMPVEVLGMSEVPPAGETFIAVADEKTAKHIAESRFSKKREEELRKNKKVSLDDLFKQIEEGEVKDLNIIIKADVQGSVEAIRQSMDKLSTTEVRVNIIHGGVGRITESDVMLAAASNAIIIGFNVRPDAITRKAAENEAVDIRLYSIIYNALDDIKAAMSGLLASTYKEVIIGRAEIRMVIKVPKAGMVAGSMVTEGKITRIAQVRVIRDGIVIHEGKIDSLKRFKDDVKEVATGFECGIGIEKFNDIIENDIIEAFIMEEIKRAL